MTLESYFTFVVEGPTFDTTHPIIALFSLSTTHEMELGKFESQVFWNLLCSVFG